MELEPIAARLAGLGFKTLDGILGLAALDEHLRSLPAAFVLPLREAASPNRYGANAIAQRVSVDFAVVIVLAAAAARKAKVAEDLAETVTAVQAALLGFTPPGMNQPITMTAARLIAVRSGHVQWAVEFRTAYELRKV